jgi:hypothetical protein
MGQQVPDRGLPFGLTQPWLITVEALEHLELTERRQHRGDILVKLELAPLNQLQRATLPSGLVIDIKRNIVAVVAGSSSPTRKVPAVTRDMSPSRRLTANAAPGTIPLATAPSKISATPLASSVVTDLSVA